MILALIERGERNLEHACRRAAGDEIEQLITRAANYREHRRYHDRVLFGGRTDGGRRLMVVAQHDPGREGVRPITAWEES